MTDSAVRYRSFVYCYVTDSVLLYGGGGVSHVSSMAECHVLRFLIAYFTED